MVLAIQENSPRGSRQCSLTNHLIPLSSLSHKVPSGSCSLRVTQAMQEPALIPRLSNMIHSRCGALVSLIETSLNQEKRAS